MLLVLSTCYIYRTNVKFSDMKNNMQWASDPISNRVFVFIYEIEACSSLWLYSKDADSLGMIKLFFNVAHGKS